MHGPSIQRNVVHPTTEILTILGLARETTSSCGCIIVGDMWLVLTMAGNVWISTVEYITCVYQMATF